MTVKKIARKNHMENSYFFRTIFDILKLHPVRTVRSGKHSYTEYFFFIDSLRSVNYASMMTFNRIVKWLSWKLRNWINNLRNNYLVAFEDPCFPICSDSAFIMSHTLSYDMERQQITQKTHSVLILSGRERGQNHHLYGQSGRQF